MAHLETIRPGLVSALGGAVPPTQRAMEASGARLVNLLFHQLGWFACVLSAAAGQPGFGAALAVALIGCHLLLAERPVLELRLLLFAAAFGLVVDSLLVNLGILVYASGMLVSWAAPPWIVVMWMQFATTFRYSMRWLSGNLLLAAAVGFFGGPLSFAAGERLGAVALSEPRLLTLAVLALSWALAMTLLAWLSRALGRGLEAPGGPTYLTAPVRR